MGLEINSSSIRLVSDDGRVVLDTSGKQIHQLEFLTGSFTTNEKGPTQLNGPFATEGTVIYDLEAADPLATVVSGLFRVTSKEGLADGGLKNGPQSGTAPHTSRFPSGDRIYIYAPDHPALNDWVSVNGPTLITTIGQASVTGGFGARGASYHFIQFFLEGGRLKLREDYIRIHGAAERGGGDVNTYKPARLTIAYRVWLGALN